MNRRPPSAVRRPIMAAQWPQMITIKSSHEFEKMAVAGACVADVLRTVRAEATGRV